MYPSKYPKPVLAAVLASVCAWGAPMAVAQEAAASGQGDDAPPLFKRLSAPTKGSRPRITVQIDPAEDYYLNPPDPVPERAEPAAVPPPQSEVFAEFWTAVSPSLSAAGPGRLEPALRALSLTGGVSGPRLDDMRRITDTYGRDILRLTVGTRISPAMSR